MKRYVGTGYTVYAHTNKTNFKTYFGQTKCEDLTRRWTGGNGYRGCPHFYAAIKKYGWDGFTHEIIQTGLTKEQADEIERENIWFFRTNEPEFGYNIQEGGHHGGSISEEAKVRRAELYSGGNSPVSKAVCVFDCNGNFEKEFPTLTEASKFYNISPGAISTRCKRKKGTLSGRLFFYKQDVDGADRLPQEMCTKPYDNSSSEKEIAQYDLNGHFIRVHSSVMAAAKSVGCAQSSISAILNDTTSRRSCVGYQWRVFSGSTDDILPYQEKKGYQKKIDYSSKRVCKIDLQSDTVLHVFNDINDAAKSENISVGDIELCLCSKVKTAGGFSWEYAGDYSKRTGKRTGSVNKRKAVAKIDPVSGETIEKFSSVSDASTKTGIRATYISGGLSGRFETVHGFKWIYCPD